MIVIGGKGVDWKPICTYREEGLIGNESEITKSKRGNAWKFRKFF